MSILTRVEQGLKDTFESLFKKKFRGDIQPVEIANALVGRLVSHRRVSVNKTYVPNAFIVRLSQHDFDKLASLKRTLQRDLVGHVMDKAEKEGWCFVAPPSIRLEVGSCEPGDIEVEAEFVEDSEPVFDTTRTFAVGEEFNQTKKQVDKAVKGETRVFGRIAPSVPSLRVASGPLEGRFRITNPCILGRGAGCDVLIPDSNVSRKHARMELQGGRWILSDLDSTNGTLVNGKQIRSANLADGDEIRLGSTSLVFEIGDNS